MKRDIKKWIKEICRGNAVDHFIKILEDDGQGGAKGEYRHKFRCRFYTRDHKYAIVAIDRSDDGYLGCVGSNRKPRAGEEWTRGNDLPDGPYTYETWHKIKNAILAYELVKVAKPREAMADHEIVVGPQSFDKL